LNFCSVQTEFGIAPPDTVLPGPAYQRPATMLPRSPLSLPHPAAHTGLPTHPTPLVSRAVLRRPCPAPSCSATTTPPAPDGRGPLPASFLRLALPIDVPEPLSLPFPSFHVAPAPDPLPHSLFLPFPLRLEKPLSAPPPSYTCATASPCKSTPDRFLSTGESIRPIPSIEASAPRRILGHHHCCPPLG
jgi:hypothetical protein